MKIEYKFVDGTVTEVEVDESIGTVIKESRCLEGNLARKESYHCHSLEAVQYEGAENSDGETPETKIGVSVKDMDKISHYYGRFIAYMEEKQHLRISRQTKSEKLMLILCARKFYVCANFILDTDTS